MLQKRRSPLIAQGACGTTAETLWIVEISLKRDRNPVVTIQVKNRSVKCEHVIGGVDFTAVDTSGPSCDWNAATSSEFPQHGTLSLHCAARRQIVQRL